VNISNYQHGVLGSSLVEFLLNFVCRELKCNYKCLYYPCINVDGNLRRVQVNNVGFCQMISVMPKAQRLRSLQKIPIIGKNEVEDVRRVWGS
jgi:hypothetical protein